MSLRTLGVLLVLTSQIGFAQAPVPSVGATAPAPPLPPRDTSSRPQTGTAVIKGRISAADTGRPLRRARITATAPELGQRGRDVSTDADGRYEIKDLPAGRYSLSVTRSGYLRLRYGQRRPLEQGRQLDVAKGQVVDNVDFALPKMSVIAGRVTDELGDPLEGASVFAMRLEYFQGKRRIVPGSQVVRTDDAGQYRITGLMPGAYWVMATLRETWTVTEAGKTEVVGYAPTYLPGTVNLAEAMRVTVEHGQQASAVDFPLVPGRAASVSGTATDGRGRALVGGSVGLSQETVGTEGGMFMTAGGAQVAADGTFTISNVSPGEYKIRARTGQNLQAGATPEIVTQVLTVDGRDIDGLHLATTAGWSMTGRIRTDTNDVPSLSHTAVSVTPHLLSPDLEPRTMGMSTSSQIQEDWTFAITNIFGPSRVHVAVPSGWAVKAVLHGDRDILDEPLDLRSGETLSDIEVVLTTVVSRVTGQVTDGKGAPNSDGTVVIFPSERARWFDRSRWVRATRPNQQGGFEIAGLPAGDYLAVAVEYVQEGVWNDPEYLATLVRQAQKVTVGTGGVTNVTLKLIGQ